MIQTKAYQQLKNDLTSIESSLKQVIQTNNQVLTDASIQLIEAGGKRIRPVFVLLSSRLGEYNFQQVKTVAVSLELIHMATLVHDDVVDNSDLRRGQPTAKKMYGNQVAMYIGDYMLARAIENITTCKNPMIHELLAKTLTEVCMGEIEQIKYKYDWEQNLRHYLRRIKRKTALLIATSCKLGAIVGGLSKKEAKELFRYGYNIGMSFQITDDILDITSTPEELGKPTGNDLLQGNMTLPVIYALKDESFKQHLEETFSDPYSVTDEQMKHLLQHLKSTGAIQRSYELSNRYIQRSFQALQNFPNSETKDSLQQIAWYIQRRNT